MKNLFLMFFAYFLTSSAYAGPIKSSFFTNDFFGDGHDRWRSASYTLFLGFEGAKTGDFRHDFRGRAEIISPWGARKQPKDDDRPYVGMLGFGMFVNDRTGYLDYNLGAEILFVGDQTKVADLQQGFHEMTDIAGYLPRNMPHEHVEDDVTGMLSAELARSYDLTRDWAFRLFLGAQAGYEAFGRIGFDIIWGGYSGAERYVRDPVSGFLQPSSPNRVARMGEMSFLVGADYTYVTHSDFFPDWSDVDMKNDRLRWRVGFQSRFVAASVFFGLTRMTKEFHSQREDQTIGVLSFEFPF